MARKSTQRRRDLPVREDFLTRVPPYKGVPTTKTRSIPYQPVRMLTERQYHHRDLYYGPAYDTPRFIPPGGDMTPSMIRGKQITVSEGHPTRKLKASGPDQGGDFFTTRQYIEGLHGRTRSVHVEWETGPAHQGQDTQDYYYNGPVYPLDIRYGPGGGHELFPLSIHSSNEELDEMGATAVARCKPTNSVANVATSLMELRADGLPKVPALQALRDKSKIRKKIGGEFLNVQFGWLPLISDYKDWNKAVATAGKVVKQYQRDAGKVVRRQYYFPLEKTSETYTADQYDPALRYMYPFWTNIPYEFVDRNLPTSRLTIETVKKVWFSGAFTYYVPTGNDTLSKLVRRGLEAQQVSGAIPTPEQIWNAAPWSWAIDWFSNMGDVISNINDRLIDGLIMRYGYVMEHTIVRHTYSVDPIGVYDGAEIAVPPISFVVETKQRRKANPFGFGITWNGLSPIQIAIAAALGVSR